MKKFALIGVAGYIAPRHLRAIKENGCQLIAAYDPFDAVGVLDSYFPNAHFFTEFERFDRFIDKQRLQGNPIDFLSVCSPNYLHDAHIRYGLRNGLDVICEKPIVLNPWNVDAIMDMQSETNKKVFPILQLRLHPAIKALREKIQKNNSEFYKINLQYITPRGKWYHHSWKGDMSKSGGIATNIGIHFFDMLIWFFGTVRSVNTTEHSQQTARGKLSFDKAEVDWVLSIDANMLPQEYKNQQTLRHLTINDEAIDFTEGFTDLHTESYREILNGKGFDVAETRSAIQLVHNIRNFPN